MTMSDFGEYLAPSAHWRALIESGAAYVNASANRVCWSDTSKFAAPLYPIQGADLARQLAALPLDIGGARVAITGSQTLSQLQPVLESLQLTTSIGALASVANLGVSCAGFALVLHRLSRMDSKLDLVLAQVARLQTAVQQIRTHQEALSVARMRSGAESLERALASEAAHARHELAMDARRLFQESRSLYLELWRHAEPWKEAEIPVGSLLELQWRYVAAALGEIQSEFVIGDEGAFRHATQSCSSHLLETFSFDLIAALRVRSDAACTAGPSAVAMFQHELPRITLQLRAANASTRWTASRLASFADDMDMARSLQFQPWEVARIVQSAKGSDVYLLGPRGHSREWR
ncbi:MAG: hypothetical protein U0263_40530 [Polyangiaceae bacterium]